MHTTGLRAVLSVNMRLAIFCLLTFRASAAVLQGVVLDDETGYPLARTLVTLTPLPGTDASPLTIRSGDRGSFSMLSVRPGWYVLRTSRKGYADTEAGQLRPGRPGIPFEVLADAQSTFLQLRMKRLGAVAGSLVDENSIGIPDLPVHVYTARKPVRRVAEGKTDDRGIFRVGGLDAGTYIVRSGAGQLEDDSGVLPTYYKYGGSVDSAERVHVRLGETQPDILIRPQRGGLMTVSGILSPPPQHPDWPVRLTVITDTGRRLIASSAGPFEAANIPPGPVELLAEGTECGSYTKLLVDRPMNGLRVGCNPLYRPFLDWRVQDTMKPGLRYPILARRVDLDGATAARTFNPNDLIMPGHYELMVQTGASHYAQSMRGSFPRQPVPEAGWFAMDFGNQVRLTILLSDTPAAITGTVRTGGKPVAGAIVYLESFDPDLPDSRLQIWSGRSDHTGKYTFAGLTPGRYRVLSSFDFDPDDRFAMNAAREVKVRDGETAVTDLELILR